MKDPQRIVGEIQAFLMASDQSNNDRLPELARDYKDGCEEVNQRLVRCSQLLRQGLRSEALHLAEAQPALLTALQTLDFPDRAAWLDVVGIYQLASPPDLEHGVSEHLSSAYTEHDPHRNLLRKHRRLALARAPLRERLAVVRELARVDSTNPIWDDDCRSYEMVRFKQLQSETIDAAKRNDLTAIEAMEGELLNESWAIRPPNSLLQWVKKAANALRQDASRRALPAIEARLNDAFSALDIASARQARAQWIETAEAAQLSSENPMRERVEPALMWIDNEDEKSARWTTYEQAVATMERALDDPGVAADALERLDAALTRAEGALLDPPGHESLSRRYRACVANLNSAKIVRLQVIIGSGVAAVILLVGVSWMIYGAYARGADHRAAAESLDTAIATGQIEAVDTVLAGLTTRPDLLKSVEIVGRMPTVEALRVTESARNRDLIACLIEAENDAPTGKEHPKIEAARKLSRTDADRLSIAIVVQRIVRRDLTLATQTDLKLQPLLDIITKELDAIEADAKIEARLGPELTARLADTAKRLMSTPDFGPPSEGGRKRVEVLQNRLTAVITAIDKMGSRTRFINQLTTAVQRLPETPEAYTSAALQLAATFQGDVREADVKKVLGPDERSVWEPALAWSRQSRAWAAETTSLGPETLRRRIEFCRAFLRQYPRSPDSAIVTIYTAYLEPLALRDSGDESLRTRLVKTLMNPSIDPLYLVYYRPNLNNPSVVQRYYFAERTLGDGTISGVEHRVASDGSTRRKTLSGNMTFGRRELSPQSKWAKRIKTSLISEDLLTDWDLLFIEWARLAAVDPEMDPICKVVVLRLILDIAAEGSLALREVLAPTRRALKAADDLAKLQWLDPEAPLDTDREAARVLIADLPDWKGLATAVKAIDARLRRATIDLPLPVGWLARAQPGWVVHYSQPAVVEKIKAGGWELVVPLPKEKAGAWFTLESTDGALPDGLGALGAEGRLVFLRPKAQNSIPKRGGLGR